MNTHTKFEVNVMSGSPINVWKLLHQSEAQWVAGILWNMKVDSHSKNNLSCYAGIQNPTIEYLIVILVSEGRPREKTLLE